MNGSRRAFLVATGTAAAGVGGYPIGAAGTATNRIIVGEGMAALAGVTTEFDRKHSDIEIETIETEGFEEFVRGETDVQQAGRPMTAAERERSRENGVEFEVAELPLGGIAGLGPSEGWCRCLSERQREEFGESGRVETWSEISSEAPDDLDPADLPEKGTNVLVRGTRSHQYAIGHGGVGFYEASPSAFESVDGDRERFTPAVRLGFGYVNLAALDREAVAALVDHQAAAATDVEHVPITGTAAD